MKRRAYYVLICYSILCTAAALYVFFHKPAAAHTTQDLTNAVDKLAARYPYLSRQSLTDNETDLLIHFVELRKTLRTTVAPWGTTFAFYFEYLPTGISIGVNEKTEFTLASLLKVPYAIAYYAQLEQSGLNIQQMATIQQSDIDNRFGALWQRGAGAQLSFDELIRIMLVESDDTAVNVLSRYIDPSVYRSVYDGLDIELPDGELRPTQLTAKSYSSILKALYFSSIINKEHSEYILSLLTQTAFNDKLVAGVPAGIPVAHKIGVIDTQLYHDCGIVYEPQRPYLLCMLSQSDEPTAQNRMKTVSSQVYSFIHSIPQ